jgi:hypothetical protein
MTCNKYKISIVSFSFMRRMECNNYASPLRPPAPACERSAPRNSKHPPRKTFLLQSRVRAAFTLFLNCVCRPPHAAFCGVLPARNFRGRRKWPVRTRRAPPRVPADAAHSYRSSAPEESAIPFLLRFSFKHVIYLSQDIIPKVVSRALESHGALAACASYPR